MPRDESLEGPNGAPASFSDQLALRFGQAATCCRRGVAALYEAIGAGNRAPSQALKRWKALFGTAGGHDLDRVDRRLQGLGAICDIDSAQVRPAELLFAVHTYFALVVKLAVWMTVRRGSAADTAAPPNAEDDAGALRSAMADLESGGVTTVRPILGTDENLFGWYTDAWTAAIEQLVRDVLAALPQPDCCEPVGRGDPLKTLYEALLPKQVRHRLGEYYTPDWLASHVLAAAEYHGRTESTLLDPTCGSGTFLVQAIRRVRLASSSEGQRPDGPALCRRILRSIVGFDLNPLAVLAARASYLWALGELAENPADLTIPVYLRDAILTQQREGAGQGAPFDFVVGNPPWIAWDNLPEAYRRATAPLWQQYGLFSLSGTEARHGGGKKDLSMLLTYVAADRYLKSGGRLAFVITQTLLQTKGAGDGFRRFRIGEDGEPLGVVRVDDLVRVRPFSGAANWTATLVLEKGRPTVYPVPYTVWVPGETGKRSASAAAGFGCRQCRAEPIAADRPSSPWFLRPERFDVPLASLVGPSDYQAHLGANSGGANGVYWVELIEQTDGGVRLRNRAEKGRGPTESVTQCIEPDLLYPLLRWGDVDRWRARPGAHLLLVQDVDSRRGIEPEAMRREYPKTLAYLAHFEEPLRQRAAYRRYQSAAAFYSMYNVGPYTTAPWKVVWRRMERRIRAAAVGPIDDPLLGIRCAVPQETCVLVAVDSAEEAHYLSAVLNSAVVDFLVRAHSVRGGKGFGTPGMLDYLRLQKFNAADGRHAALARSGGRAHAAAASGQDLGEIEREIDQLAGTLWKLTEESINAIRESLE